MAPLNLVQRGQWTLKIDLRSRLFSLFFFSSGRPIKEGFHRRIFPSHSMEYKWQRWRGEFWTDPIFTPEIKWVVRSSEGHDACLWANFSFLARSFGAKHSEKQEEKGKRNLHHHLQDEDEGLVLTYVHTVVHTYFLYTHKHNLTESLDLF